MTTNYWNLKTKFLHLGMAVTVSLQLLISQIMAAPDEEKASALAKAAFEAHEVIGLLALVIIIIHWLVSLKNEAGHGISHLFPWTGEAWLGVKADIKNMLQNKQLPESGPRAGLPGFVHGLGFLAATGMALTGAVLWLTFPEVGEPGVVAEFFAETHETIAGFVWVYWLGHVALAILHHVGGSNTLKNMFNYRKSVEQ